MFAERIEIQLYHCLLKSKPHLQCFSSCGLYSTAAHLDCIRPNHTLNKKRNLMSHCGRITVYLSYLFNRRSMRTVNVTLEVWAWQVHVSGYHDSGSSLQRTKWIVQMFQLERNSTKQRAIQHAFKWNKSQFPPTADAQRTVKRALWFYISLLWFHLFLCAHSPNLSFGDNICKDFLFCCWSDYVFSFFLPRLYFSFILKTYWIFPFALRAAWILHGMYWTGCRKCSQKIKTHATGSCRFCNYCTHARCQHPGLGKGSVLCWDMGLQRMTCAYWDGTASCWTYPSPSNSPKKLATLETLMYQSHIQGTSPGRVKFDLISILQHTVNRLR